MSYRLSPTYRYFGLAGMVALQQGTTDTPANLEAVQGKLTVVPYFWNPDTLAFEVGRQPSTGGGGAGSSSVDATLSSGGSTRLVGLVGQSVPGSSDNYFWTKSVTGAGAGSTVVDINSISSSTAHLGDVSISNQTTSVTLTNPATSVTLTNPTTIVDLSSNGSTRTVGVVGVTGTVSVTGTTAVNVANPTTAVTISNTSFSVTNPATSVTITNPATAVTVSNPTTAVDLSSNGSTRVVGTVNVTSGSILGAGSSANTLGSVALVAGTSANLVGGVVINSGTTAITVGSVALLGGSSANLVGGVVINSGTTAITLGAAALLAGSSANLVGGVVINSGTTAITLGGVALLGGTTANVVGAVALTSGVATIGNLQKPSVSARTTLSVSTVDSTLLAPNTARFGGALYNAATCDALIGLSTVAVSTSTYNFKLVSGAYWEIPYQFTGGLRGIWTASGSTGGMFITEITS